MTEQITTFDERWYKVDDQYLPSVTWILDAYPKGFGFHNWLKELGDAADAVKELAADRGSRAHAAIQDLLSGALLTRNAPYWSEIRRENVPLSDTEWKHLMSFVKFWLSLDNPKLLTLERTVYSFEYKFAGTADAIIVVGDTLIVCDWKTSSAIHRTYAMQVACYAKAIAEMVGLPVNKAMVVRTNTKHKATYEVLELDKEAIEKEFTNFLKVKAVWEIEQEGKSPKLERIPSTLQLQVEMYDTSNDEILSKLMPEEPLTTEE